MPTKYRLRHNKHLENCQWLHLISVDFPETRHRPYDYDYWGYRNVEITDGVEEQKETILGLLHESYGPQDGLWNIRWSDAGADSRFKTESDAASFLMLYTLQPIS